MKRDNCCVPLCKNYRGKAPQGTTFHRIPKDDTMRKKWIIKIRRDEGKLFRIGDNTRVCSVHFQSQNFMTILYSGKRMLKRNAIPSIFPWSAKHQGQLELARNARMTASTVKRAKVLNSGEVLQAQNEDHEQRDDNQELNEDVNENRWDERLKIYCDAMVQCEIRTPAKVLPSPAVDCQLVKCKSEIDILKSTIKDLKLANCKLGEEKTKLVKKCQRYRRTTLSYESIKKNDKLVNFYTGLPKASVFDSLYEHLAPKAEHSRFWKGKNNKNREGNNKIKFSRPSNLTTKDMLFMTLVRLKMAFPVVEIARLFCISQASVTVIFTTWIAILFHELKEMFPVLPANHIKSNCPSHFQNYPETTLVIDCAELRIQTKSLSQHQTCSNQKHDNKFKFLIAATPNGSVCFVSELFGGSTTDKQIIRESHFLDVVTEGHQLMADKSFEIDDILPQGVTLNILPKYFNHISGQMPVNDVAKARQIASVRTDIKRIIQRVKTFRLVANVIPFSMKDIANQVVTVCCYLCNFMSGIHL